MTASYTTHLTNGYANDSSSYTNGHHVQSMDGRQGEYSQPGLSPPEDFGNGAPSKDHNIADPSVAAQYTPQQDAKHQYSATPNSEYSLNPSSARSGTFPDYVRTQYPDASQRYHHPNSAPGSAPSNMAQSTSPSNMPFVNGQTNGHEPRHPHSNGEIPVDPNIAASSPTHPPQYQQYPPYPPPQHEMPHYQHGPPMYPRQDYGQGYPGAPHHGMAPGPYGHVPTSVSFPPSMVPASRPPGGGHPMSTVYSFVPIPGTHQQKRPRRRYEEIERMYKCGWQGCEKAYGTLNHLNAHVTMQSHGQKRTPEEFKEIRKEWKARKKEEENARKADEERARQTVPSHAPVDGQNNSADGTPNQQQQASGGYPSGGGVRQLPPLGYVPASGGVPQGYGQGNGQMEGMPQYSSGPMPSYPGYPQSPYGQTTQMYHQHPPPILQRSRRAKRR